MRKHLSWVAVALGLVCSLTSSAAPAALADVSSSQAAALSGSSIPVLVPYSGQPFSDQVPTTIHADASGYELDYGLAPTFALRGSTTDPGILTPPYVCGDDATPYCTDVALTTASGEQAGDEVFRGLGVGDGTAIVEHFTCCNGKGWRIDWTAPSSGAWYSILWKGDVSFAPSDTPSFDPNNVQYAQALAAVAAALVPLATPSTAQPAPAVEAPPASIQPPSLCGAAPNPWGYNLCGNGVPVSAPPRNFCSYFNCIPSFWNQTNGYVAQCADRLFSHSGGVRGACSGHGGVASALSGP